MVIILPFPLSQFKATGPRYAICERTAGSVEITRDDRFCYLLPARFGASREGNQSGPLCLIVTSSGIFEGAVQTELDRRFL